MALIQLIVLFTVIFDPLASFAVFYSSTSRMKKRERNHVGLLAIFVAASISFLVLVFGEKLLVILSTTVDEFRVAGGIVLSILGVKMALGHSPLIANFKDNSAKAVAAIIGTPFLTGPAAITAIIVSVQDYGRILTGSAVFIVLALTGLLFYNSEKMKKIAGDVAVRVVSTILGLVTLAWGVRFIAEGIKAVLLYS